MAFTIRIPLWTRLWKQIAVKFDEPDACWLWTGATRRTRRGRYGKFWEGGRHGRNLSPHRVVCYLMHGPPPTRSHEAGHTCPGGENPLCCNPAHVEWQTREQNEAWKRGIRPVVPVTVADLMI